MAEDADEDEGNHTPWHRYDWDAVLSGQGTADRYFARPGLIRKDRLAIFAPRGRHPETEPVRSFEDLGEKIEEIGIAEGTEKTVQFVLKQAHSSNAQGIRFLTGSNARSVLDALSGGQLEQPVNASIAPVSSTSSSPMQPVYVASIAGAFGLAAFLLQRGGRLSVPALWPTQRSPRDRATFLCWAAVVASSASALCYSLRLALPQQQTTQRSVVEDLQELLASPKQGKANVWILQKHIAPFLHEGRKFHLRALVLCVGDLRVYMHEDVRMLLATEPFDVGRQDGTRVFAHVTNMGANTSHSEYGNVAQNLPLSALGAELSQRVFSEAAQVVGATLDRICAGSTGRRHFFTTSNCWELFGVDFLMEEGSGRVVLLEMNATPSLAMYGEGSSVRDHLVGPNPLEAIPPSFSPVPLKRPVTTTVTKASGGDT